MRLWFSRDSEVSLRDQLVTQFVLAILGGVLVATVFATVLGWFCLRRRQVYFSMLTLAFAQLGFFIAFEARGITGGDDGLRNIQTPPLDLPGISIALNPIRDPAAYFYLTAAILVVVGLALATLASSPTRVLLDGRRLAAWRLPGRRVEVAAERVSHFKAAGKRRNQAGAVLFTVRLHEKDGRAIALPIMSAKAYAGGHDSLWIVYYAVATGLISLARKQLGESSPQAETLKQALEQARRVSKIVGDLRQFAEQEKSHGGRRFPLSQPVRGALDLYAEELRGRRIEVRQELQDGLREAQGDPVQIQQVIAHLVQNAIAAMPEDCRKRSRIGLISIQSCMVLFPALAAVNTLVYGWSSPGKMHDRSTLRQGLARSGPQDAGRERFHGVESRPAGQGDGGVARQLLLAFRRHRRVPRRDP